MTLLTASDLTVAIGRHRIVAEIDFSIDRGELLGLIGPNGAGKTSLLRAVLGLVDSTSGNVLLDGIGIGGLTLRERARRIAYLPQISTVHWPIAVRRLVALGRLPHLGPWQSPSAEDEAAIDNALADTDISELQDRTLGTLSGGERRLATLARALAVGADLLLADEPVVALDPGHQLQVMTLLHNMTRHHRAAIVVLHDLTLASRFCDRLILLHGGRIKAQGSPHEVLNEANLASVYGVQARFGQPPNRYIVPWERV